MKAAAYAQNWGSEHLICADVAKLRPSDLPGRADLAWASFPCQDLSRAGDGRGLGRATAEAKTRSGTFWSFWALVEALKAEGRAPRAIVLENVYGTLTSHGGCDFSAICAALSGAGYRFGAMVIDARLFLPQSRPRVFFIAVATELTVPSMLLSGVPDERLHPKALLKAHAGISGKAPRNWIWWRLKTPEIRNTVFADVIEDNPTSVAWHTPAETKRLLSLMSPVNRAKVEAAKKTGKKMVGAVYRRTRLDESGEKSQRAEVRFDDVAGCLRTPRGGSSRQSILIVERQGVRSRLLSPREAARLMGLDDTYILPQRYNDAYHVAGDGVCVPVVRYLAQNFLEPLLKENNIANQILAAE
jgi:DNA (cytosine-5)-methyltransferase 1